MGWFSKKSVAPQHAPFIPTWLSAGMGDGSGEVPRSYAGMVDEVFRRNPVGQRAVRLVAGALGNLTVEAVAEDAEAKMRAEAILRQPGLLEEAGAALLLHGNAYLKLIFDMSGAPKAVHLLRPEWVEVDRAEGGAARAYLYGSGDGRLAYASEDAEGRALVGHVRHFDPTSDVYGGGCLDAAVAAAAVHNQAAKWNKALLDNAARPSGAISYEPGDGSSLSMIQFDRLKSELDLQFQGARNAGRPMLLEGGLKWVPLSMSPAEMDFAALKESAARDIALAFGVPPVLVGLPGDATYANAREAGRALYRQTVLPLSQRLLRGLAALLSDWLGPLELVVDSDQISELAEDRARLWQQVNAADFISADEKRAMVGYPPAPQDEEAGA